MDMSLFEHEYDRETFLHIAPDGKPFKMWTNEHCSKAYQRASFEEYSVRLVSLIAPELACFMDVGAHHGYYSLLVGSLSPQCEIFAFEPTTENYLTLKKNLDENQLGGANTYPCAISNVEETKDFYISTASDNCSFIIHPTTPTQKIVPVQAYPLDHFRSKMPDGATLIKIDTEGHELNVLDGMREIINSIPDLRLLIECNPKLLKIAGHAPEEMFAKLDAFGFDLYLLSDQDGLFFRLPKDAKCEDYLVGPAVANILCLRKQPRINFLFFSHSAELNGAERSMLEQVEHFIARGNMCTVVVPAQGPMIARLQKMGAAVVLGRFDWWCGTPQVAPSEQADRLGTSFVWLLENAALLKKINPDVFFTNTTVIPWGALAAVILGKPHLWSVTEFGEASGLQYFVPFADVLKIIVESSNFIFTNSNSVRSALFNDLGPDRVVTIYRTVSIPAVQPQISEERVFVRPAATRLILVGTIGLLKKQRDAVMAVNELVFTYKKDVELIIIGSIASIDYRNELFELIQQCNLQGYVHLMDFQENIFPMLYQADIALTCAPLEPIGRTTLEAMLCGKPVIGVNRAGTAELIQDGLTGLLYEPGDFLALAQKIAYLCDHPEKRSELGQNGLEYVRKSFTIETTYERALQIAFAVKDQKNSSVSPMLAWMVGLSKNTFYLQRVTANQKEQTLANQQEYIASLVASHAEKEQIIVNAHKYIASLVASHTEKEQTAQSLSTELNEVYKSKAWRSILIYRRLIGRLRNLFH